MVVRHLEIDWLKAARFDLPESIGTSDPDSLAQDLEELGPTFVKLGQMISSRPDFVPQRYIEALSQLQQNVGALDIETVEAVIEEELGAPPRTMFDRFERTPMASASLGQAHRALLVERVPDGADEPDPAEGDRSLAEPRLRERKLVIKVQRPGIRESILQDFEILEQIARTLDRSVATARRLSLPSVVDEMRSSLLRELDYRVEAKSLDRLGEIVADYPHIKVPSPVSDRSTSRVLTMDLVDGEALTTVGPARLEEIDGAVLAEELFAAYLDQVLIHGFFHADPHPGNVLITTDGSLALIDLGMTGELSKRRRDQLTKLILAAADGRAEEAAEICLEIGSPEPHFDQERFDRGVAALLQKANDSSLEEMQFGVLMLSMTRLASECGLRTAPEFSMLAKTLLQLDQTAQVLDPQFEPMESLRRHVKRIVGTHLLEGLAPASLVSAGLEMRELIQTLPKRANAVLGALAENRLSVGIDAIDEERLHSTLRTAANRLAVSIVLAALILGAALVIQIDTSFRLFGYPAIALALFLMAAACGFYLVFDVFRGEAGKRRDRR